MGYEELSLERDRLRYGAVSGQSEQDASGAGAQDLQDALAKQSDELDKLFACKKVPSSECEQLTQELRTSQDRCEFLCEEFFQARTASLEASPISASSELQMAQ